MKSGMRLGLILSASVLAIPARGEGPTSPKSSIAERLADARQFGWAAAAPLMENLGQSDPEKFPGIRAFFEDYKKAVKGIDPGQPPDRWSPIDIDGLITRNPNFWRANFEIRPGDPAWLYVHAGLLLGAGEATRAQQLLGLALQSRGAQKEVRDAIDQMIAVAERVILDANEAVGAGIELYDKGDRLGAIRRYRDALAAWPQNSFAHYELALSLRTRAMEAKGEPIPKLGTVLINPKFPKMPDVEEHFARARQHDPLRWEAYQGSGEDVLPRLLAIQRCVKAWQSIASSRGEPVPDEVLVQFSEGCQEAGIHDLALVARQLAVWRRGGLGRADHAFISTSLTALAPGPQSEAILKYLDNPQIEMRAVSEIVPEDPRP